MPTRSETTFTIVVTVGMAFGVLCTILGISGGNYALLGAGILALGSGAVLILLMMRRWSSQSRR
ncbi:hypothetical protein FHS40_004103 [Streptomyces spectabilis]|uniref:Uncharacterized protein n=1 Tax=Streptomyces spectabilis TaxID=68270 RepID=A0A7W8EVU2_STRST|nr:hypothetical protein [Streptomyces spectabilis]